MSRPVNPGNYLWLALDKIGEVVINLLESLRFITDGRIHWKNTLQQAAVIGTDSLPMALAICLIAGCVLALQTADAFSQTGATSYVGGMVAIAVVREIAPIFTCLAVSARSGTAIASEIANMRVTNQVDALISMHVSPIRYLLVPRFLACVLCLPMLTLVSEVIAILGGMVVARLVSNLHYSLYLDSVWLYLSAYDIRISLLKAAVFGALMAMVCGSIGLMTRGGAKDVGVSTMRAAVWTAICIIVADFFLSWIFFGTRFERERV